LPPTPSGALPPTPAGARPPIPAGAPPPTPFADRAIGRLRALTQRLEREPDVLELGAGAGRDARALAGAGARVVALELAEGAARILSHVDRVAPVVADLRAPLPFPAGRFDAVYSHMVLSCDFQDAEIDLALAEVHRVLRDGGELWISVRSTDDPIYRLGPQPGAGHFPLGDAALHFFSRRTLRHFLRAFQIDTLEPVTRELDGETYGMLEVFARKVSATKNDFLDSAPR
jgi:SAM-dependent methyltransferase